MTARPGAANATNAAKKAAAARSNGFDPAGLGLRETGTVSAGSRQAVPCGDSPRRCGRAILRS